MRGDSRGGGRQRGGGRHPLPQPNLCPAPLPSHPIPAVLPLAPAWAPCHREALPQKDQHQQEDEEAGGEEQLGWEEEERAAQMQGSGRARSPTPSQAHFVLTQDLQALVANAIRGILAPVDAEK